MDSATLSAFSRKPYDPRNVSTLQNIWVCPVCVFCKELQRWHHVTGSVSRSSLSLSHLSLLALYISLPLSLSSLSSLSLPSLSRSLSLSPSLSPSSFSLFPLSLLFMAFSGTEIGYRIINVNRYSVNTTCNSVCTLKVQSSRTQPYV